MKRILLAGTIVLLTWVVAFAKPVDLNMEFTMDAEFLPYVDSYVLYSEVPGSGSLVVVANIPKTAQTTIQVTALELDPGKVTNFYLAAKYGTGTEAVEDVSLGLPFKFTGKPVWVKINKR